MESQTKRTIEEVLDIESGELIDSNIFFKQPESILIAFRRRLEEAIQKISPPKLVCPYCHQLLKISGKPTKRGIVSYFAHQRDSDECEIKTNGNYTKDELEAIKYAGIKESERHLELKEKIFKALTAEQSQLLGLKNAEIEKHFKSNNPLLNWRRPDVYAEFNNYKIVFEIQLSTTFLSVIVARDIFYRFNNTFIIWVFNFSENHQYVNLHNLMCKDIYYANRRNAFVFDAIAQERSVLEQQLILKCIWFEPTLNPGGIPLLKEEYIKLSDLTFTSDDYRPYYIDADKLFIEMNPDIIIERNKIETAIEHKFDLIERNLLEKLNKIENDKVQLALQQEKELQEIILNLRNGNKYDLELKKKDNRWGYKVGNYFVIQPIYIEATDFNNLGLAIVRKEKLYGAINMMGTEIIPFSYASIRIFSEINKLILVRIVEESEKVIYGKFGYFHPKKDLFGMLDHNGNVKLNPIYTEIHESDLDLIILKQGKFFGFADKYCNLIAECIYDSYSQLQNGNILVKINGKYGVLNTKGETILPFIYSDFTECSDGRIKVLLNNLYGFINQDGSTAIPIGFDFIEDFRNGRANASKNNKWGVIDDNGNIIIECKYDERFSFYNNTAKVKHSGLIGYIDIDGFPIIPCKYSEILYFTNNVAIATKDMHYGCIDINGNEIIPFIYQKLEQISGGLIKTKKHGKWGVLNNVGTEIIPIKFNIIRGFNQGRAFAKLNKRWGVIDFEGNTLIDFKYDYEFTFKNDRAEVSTDGLKGVIDYKGIELIPCKYDELKPFEYQTYLCKNNGLWGAMSIDGDLTIPCLFESIYNIGNVIVGIKNGRLHLIGSDGIVLSKGYDSINSFGYGYYEVKNIDKFGLIYTDGNEIAPCIYDKITVFDNTSYLVFLNGKYGIINKSGKVIIDVQYEEIINIQNNYVKVKQNAKWGVIDVNGIIKVKPIYDELGTFYTGGTLITRIKTKINGLARYKFGDKRGYVDINGKEYWQYWKDNRDFI